MMNAVLFLLLSSFVLSALLTPVFQKFLVRVRIVDHPDARRKLHSRPIPRAGGIAIAVSFVASYAVVMAWPSTGGALLKSSLPFVWGLLPAFGVVFLTGLLDDVSGLRPWQKLLGQSLAGGLAYWAGVRVGSFADQWWSLPLTVLWLVACANAVNLLDGIDGLAAGVGVFAATTSLLAGFIQNDLPLMLATAPLVGSLLAFLRYNFSPASIFLGDSGSLLIGFLLGCYGVLWSQKSATLLGMTAPLMLLAVPLLDTTLAVIRRYLLRKPIFQADRGHIHHRLLDSGCSPRRAVLILYAVCGFAAMFSLIQRAAHQRYEGLVVVAFCLTASAGLWFALQRLGYLEVGLASRMLLRGDFSRRSLEAHLSLEELKRRLASASTVHTCWTAIRKASEELGFAWVSVHFSGTRFRAEFGDKPRELWSVCIPLTDRDYIELGRDFRPGKNELALSSLISTIRDMVGPKMRELEFPAGSTGQRVRAAGE